MAQLTDKVQNALDETRMLILGAQVLLGFQFQSTLQPVFDRLPPTVQIMKVVGLGLMLVVTGLLMVPGAFHQIAERGDDSPRVVSFTSRIAAWALLPFAVSLGIDVYVAAFAVLGPGPALPGAIAATAFALVWWYGVEWTWRATHPTKEARPVNATVSKGIEGAASTPLDVKIKQVLTEARVVLPGAQALLGFQFAAILMDAFSRLPRPLQYVHLTSLALIGVTIVLLMAPAAFHRIVERGEDSPRLHRFASAMVLGAMVPLALGIAGDFYVVADKVLESGALALALACASVLFYLGLWFGVTLTLRARVRDVR